MKIIVKYTQKDYNSECETSCYVLPVNMSHVPDRASRKDIDIYYWVTSLKITDTPNRKPDYYEDKGNGWTSHLCEYWVIED